MFVARAISYIKTMPIEKLRLAGCYLLWAFTAAFVLPASYLFVAGLYGVWTFDADRYLPDEFIVNVLRMAAGFCLALPSAILAYFSLLVTEKIHLGSWRRRMPA